MIRYYKFEWKKLFFRLFYAFGWFDAPIELVIFIFPKIYLIFKSNIMQSKKNFLSIKWLQSVEAKNQETHANLNFDVYNMQREDTEFRRKKNSGYVERLSCV